jgi:hypothetical protein
MNLLTVSFRHDAPPRCPLCCNEVNSACIQWYHGLAYCQPCTVVVSGDVLEFVSAMPYNHEFMRHFTNHRGLHFYAPAHGYKERVATHLRHKFDGKHAVLRHSDGSLDAGIPDRVTAPLETGADMYGPASG